jgi:DNA-binding NarL/FixJ family response regulator
VRLIAWGYSNKEIAARMGLSVKSVESFKARALKKLGGRSRVDLVRYAFRQGWLDAPADG